MNGTRGTTWMKAELVHVVFRLSRSMTIDNRHSLSSHINMSDITEIRKKYRQFRILVIGRANAGKTTLLKRVCNTNEEPCIYDKENNKLVRYLSFSEASVLMSFRLVGANERGTSPLLYWVSNLDFLVSSSVVFMTSTVRSPSGATQNSYFMTLLGSKVETSVSLRMFKTSLQSMQKQQILRISFTLSGQFSNLLCCLS